MHELSLSLSLSLFVSQYCRVIDDRMIENDRNNENYERSEREKKNMKMNLAVAVCC